MQVSWKLKSACLRIRARVDKGAATLCAALSRCVDQWSKTRGVAARDGNSSTINRASFAKVSAQLPTYPL